MQTDLHRKIGNKWKNIISSHFSLGRYPFHYHMCCDLANRTLYPNPSYLRKNSIHHTQFRCFTIHGTQSAILSFIQKFFITKCILFYQQFQRHLFHSNKSLNFDLDHGQCLLQLCWSWIFLGRWRREKRNLPRQPWSGSEAIRGNHCPGYNGSHPSRQVWFVLIQISSYVSIFLS